MTLSLQDSYLGVDSLLYLPFMTSTSSLLLGPPLAVLPKTRSQFNKNFHFRLPLHPIRGWELDVAWLGAPRQVYFGLDPEFADL